MQVGDLVKTPKGNLALVTNIDEVARDKWGMATINFVTLIYSRTGVVNRYCDARFLKVVA